MYRIIIGAFIALSTLVACEQPAVFPASEYACELSVNDPSANHPKAATWQSILDAGQKNGLV
ncbi:MAG: hypothetical protein AAF206_29505, partial [Bacteroidota bacterium]